MKVIPAVKIYDIHVEPNNSDPLFDYVDWKKFVLFSDDLTQLKEYARYIDWVWVSQLILIPDAVVSLIEYLDIESLIATDQLTHEAIRAYTEKTGKTINHENIPAIQHDS